MSEVEKLQLADAASLSTEVASVCQKLAVCERMEVLSLLEVAVWRMKVEEEKATRNNTRESCRVNCGSNIVLTNVMTFLDRATDTAPYCSQTLSIVSSDVADAAIL
jgi:hypothetical protein